MGYINFTLLKSRKLEIKDFLILQVCRQMKYEDLSEVLVEMCGDEEILLTFEEDGLVSFVKGKAKDNLFQKARLTKKGTNLLDDLDVPEIIEEDVIIFQWLEKAFKKRDRKTGNAKKARLYIANFRQQTGISGNNLIYLCNSFLKDESKMAWTIRLDYVFFKPANLFSVKFDLEESKLWHYYLDNQAFFDKEFERIEKESAEKRAKNGDHQDGASSQEGDSGDLSQVPDEVQVQQPGHSS